MVDEILNFFFWGDAATVARHPEVRKCYIKWNYSQTSWIGIVTWIINHYWGSSMVKK